MSSIVKVGVYISYLWVRAIEIPPEMSLDLEFYCVDNSSIWENEQTVLIVVKFVVKIPRNYWYCVGYQRLVFNIEDF